MTEIYLVEVVEVIGDRCKRIQEDDKIMTSVTSKVGVASVLNFDKVFLALIGPGQGARQRLYEAGQHVRQLRACSLAIK